MEESKEIRNPEERNADGTFNKTPANAGRPKGSRNKITLLKLIAEESYREGNKEKIQQVLNKIVDQALKGDKASQKLVWNSAVSASNTDDNTHAQEKVVIRIDAVAPLEKVVTIIDQTDEEEEDATI